MQITDPHPLMMIVDEKNGPGLSLIQTCSTCGAIVSQHDFNVSLKPRVDLPWVERLGKEAGEAWLEHEKKHQMEAR